MKAVVQSYDWGVPIMVDEQCVGSCGMESHPDEMSAEVTEGFPRG